MSILILNRADHDDFPYEIWLQDCQEALVLLSCEEVVDQFPRDRYAYMEGFPKYRVNGNVELRALELHNLYDFHTIIAVAEVDLDRASHLRAILGINGQQPFSTRLFRDKILMKQRAQRSGLAVPPFAPLSTPLDLIQFIQEHDYPIIVKPVDGVGSVGTSVLSSLEEVKKYLFSGISSNLEVEKFVEGEMYHVDGLIIDGQVRFTSVSKYASNCLAFQTGGANASYLLAGDHPLRSRMIQSIISLLAVFEIPPCMTFHAELFHTFDDEIVLCEIASRTGGGRLNEYIKVAYSIDMNQAWIRSQCGLLTEIPENYDPVRGPFWITGDILIPPKKGILVQVMKQPLPEWVLEYRIHAQEGMYYSEPERSVDHIASFVVKGETEEEVQVRLFQLAEWFERDTVWKLDVDC